MYKCRSSLTPSIARTLAPSAHPPEGFLLYRNCEAISYKETKRRPTMDAFALTIRLYIIKIPFSIQKTHEPSYVSPYPHCHR